MAKFKTIVTTVGAAKIAAVLAGTGSIVLDNKARMAVGDGNGTLPTPVPSQTALVHEVHRAALNSVSIDSSDPKNIVVELVIPPETGGFWIREMALYDAAGTLLAVGNMAETYKPSLSEGAGRKSVIRMVIAVSDVSAVTITMDSSTVMATKEYVDDKIDEHEKSRKHPDATLTAKGFTQLNSATDSASETQAATPKAVKAVMDAANTKAPLANPAMTGVPTVPTPAPGTNTKQVANTEFVRAAISALINSSPGLLDTLGELAAALGNDANFATTMANALAGKQPLDTTLSNLSGKTVAGLLQYLGLSKVMMGDWAYRMGFIANNKERPYVNHQDSGDNIVLATAESVSTSLKDRQPLDNTLTALAGLANGANKIPYFNGTDSLAVADLSSFIRTMLGKGDAAAVLTYLGLKSAAQKDVGISTNQIPDMNSFASSLGTTGYQKLPGGIIIQWGRFDVAPTSGVGTTDITFPIAFPSAVRTISALMATNDPSQRFTGFDIANTNANKTRFTYITPTSNGIYWIAIGH